ncbi:MAG: DUF397 domain-containing protein [Micromonosporaceae bacterium]
MTSFGLAHAHWRKSTYSNASGNCVEVAAVTSAGVAAVAVRDSKDPHAREVRFHADQWKAFLARVKEGGLDLA